MPCVDDEASPVSFPSNHYLFHSNHCLFHSNQCLFQSNHYHVTDDGWTPHSDEQYADRHMLCASLVNDLGRKPARTFAAAHTCTAPTYRPFPIINIAIPLLLQDGRCVKETLQHAVETPAPGLSPHTQSACVSRASTAATACTVPPTQHTPGTAALAMPLS